MWTSTPAASTVISKKGRRRASFFCKSIDKRLKYDMILEELNIFGEEKEEYSFVGRKESRRVV